jgi:hypothetical protein
MFNKEGSGWLHCFSLFVPSFPKKTGILKAAGQVDFSRVFARYFPRSKFTVDGERLP